MTRAPHARPGESFQGLLLSLRGRSGMSQRELAASLQVHRRSIQGWESGANYPSAPSLQALIVVYLAADAFGDGREADQASTLWATALRQAPRMRTPFDPQWFARVLSERNTRRAALARQDWGEAPAIGDFWGRDRELDDLTQWVAVERCRVVILLGLGGIGKTTLAAQLADRLAPDFDRVYWRNLQDGLPPGEWLAGAIAFLSDRPTGGATPETARLSALLEVLRERRCLLVLDNVETTLKADERVPTYREGYELYGSLMRQLGQASHKSCLLLTGRAVPPELEALRGEQGAVRSLEVGGLDTDAGRALLQDKALFGSDSDWAELVNIYRGNGLALKVAGEAIRRVFGGDIALFLRRGDPFFGGIGRLFDEQLVRLPALEQSILRWLAIARKPLGLEALGAALGAGLAPATLVEALAALRGRSLIADVRTQPGTFALQSVVLAYVIGTLVEEFAREIMMREPAGLLTVLPLMQAEATENVRRSQVRQIAAPVLDRLVSVYAGPGPAARAIVDVLELQRARSRADQGYGPGNLINLLRLVQGNLRGANLSGLNIREAYLVDADAADASLLDSDVTGSALAEAFHFPVSLVLSPDGEFVAAGTRSGEVRLWRMSTRRVAMSLVGHAGPVLSTAFSRDGRLLASSSSDGDIRVWDSRNGQQVALIQGHGGVVTRVSLNDHGDLLMSAGANGRLNVWQTSTGRRLSSIVAHDGVIYGGALSADGRLLASGGIDGAVRLWDATSGHLVAELEGQVGPVSDLAFSSDGRVVATGGTDGTVRLWDTTTGRQPVATLPGLPGPVVPVTLSQDGQLVASASSDGTLRLWNAHGQQLLAIPHYYHRIVRAVTLDAKGQLLASAGSDGTVRLWQMATGDLVGTLQGHSQAIHCVTTSTTGRLIANGTIDGSIALWDASGQRVATLKSHIGAVYGVALSDNGRWLASGGLDGTARLWDTTTGRELKSFDPNEGPISGVALTGDGRLLAASTAQGVHVWPRGRRKGQGLALRGHEGLVWSVAMTRDGRLLVSGGIDGMLRLWNTATGQIVKSFSVGQGEIFGAALSDEGTVVAAGEHDGTVTVWDVATEQILATAQAHNGVVYSVALSRDGRVLASAGQDGTVRVWQMDGLKSPSTLSGHTGAVWGVAFTADGKQLVSGGEDGTTKLWDVTTGEVLRTLRADRLYERLDITGLAGVTAAQRDGLTALGAYDRGTSVHA